MKQETENDQIDLVLEQAPEKDDLPNINRRSFFTRTLLGGGAAIAAGGATVVASKMSLEGRIDKVGIEIDKNTFHQMDERNTTLSYANSKLLTEEVYPERVDQYMKLNETDFHFFKTSRGYVSPKNYWANRPGYTQADMALSRGAGYPAKATGSKSAIDFVPNDEFQHWDQSGVWHEQFDFGSDQNAADMIRSAARLYGATRVGIAKFDKRFVYNPMFNRRTGKTMTWEDDFPFEPKTVIVMAVPTDYDAVAAAPGFTATAATTNGYMDMSKTVTQMGEFVRKLGFHAVASGNDMALSVAFGILAGMGEGGRNNMLIMPGVGPRARLCKVFTDLDFGDAYDEPRSWGVAEFCESCMKCADACPSGAISTEVERSFEPKYKFSEEPGYTWNNHHGVKKWHSDSKKCFNFWVDNSTSCVNCLASCTFNEPDYWHHWLIMAVNPAMPKFVHSLMAESHPAFGYGGQGPTPIPEKVKKFWKSGRGMRTNLSNKDNQYTSGQS